MYTLKKSPYAASLILFLGLTSFANHAIANNYHGGGHGGPMMEGNAHGHSYPDHSFHEGGPVHEGNHQPGRAYVEEPRVVVPHHMPRHYHGGAYNAGPYNVGPYHRGYYHGHHGYYGPIIIVAPGGYFGPCGQARYCDLSGFCWVEEYCA